MQSIAIWYPAELSSVTFTAYDEAAFNSEPGNRRFNESFGG